MKEMFFQLRKVGFDGVAEGVMACQELDHDGEVLDYAASKPYFEAWSLSQYQMSGGKSYGNVRLQHDSTRPVGRLLKLGFDDSNKQVTCTAKIEEAEARNLLATGVLTGFSIGGDYVSKTPVGGGVVKYVANPNEVSVCDRPCAPSAVFHAVKADGSMELRKFAKPRKSVWDARDYSRVVRKVRFMGGRIAPNQELAIRDFVVKNATQAVAELKNSDPHALGHNQIDLAGFSTYATVGKDDKFKLRNKNIGSAQSDYAGLTGIVDSETLVKARAECARHCKMQGRTACKWCGGEGFAAKSARENSPSKHDVHKSRFVMPSSINFLRKV